MQAGRPSRPAPAPAPVRMARGQGERRRAGGSSIREMPGPPAGTAPIAGPSLVAGAVDALDAVDAVDAVDALLPQTQCRRCGYDACRPYAQALVRGDADLNRCPPGRGGHHRGARPHPGTAREGARSRLRRDGAARGRDHRRERVHRMHGMHPRVPGGRDHRCAQVDARGAGERMHGLRPVRGALPGGLHRHGAGAHRSGDARRVARRARPARPAAVRASAGPRIGASTPRRIAGGGPAGSTPPTP